MNTSSPEFSLKPKAVARCYAANVQEVSDKVETYSMAGDARKVFDTVKLPGVRVLSVELAEDSNDELPGRCVRCVPGRQAH